jgi:hypothetical protein
VLNVDIGKLYNPGDGTVATTGADYQVDVETIDIVTDNKSSPRPMSEMTAEIIRNMDRLCDWLHKVQKLHLEITRVREQRMEAEIAARWAQMHEYDRDIMPLQ